MAELISHDVHFVQTTSDIATCMYYTGIDPFTKNEVYMPKELKDRKMQRALMQFLSRQTASWFGRR